MPHSAVAKLDLWSIPMARKRKSRTSQFGKQLEKSAKAGAANGASQAVYLIVGGAVLSGVLGLLAWLNKS